MLEVRMLEVRMLEVRMLETVLADAKAEIAVRAGSRFSQLPASPGVTAGAHAPADCLVETGQVQASADSEVIAASSESDSFFLIAS